MSVINDIEPDFTLFQADRPLAVFLHEGMFSLMFSLMERFVLLEVLQANSTTRKLVKIDLTDESNLLPTNI